MNILLNKLKKASKVQKFFYYLTTLLYFISLIYFIYSICHLSIETFLRVIAIILFICWLFFYILYGLIKVVTKKKLGFIIITIITFIFIPLQFGSSYIINYVYGNLKNMNRETITYRTNLIALKETEFDDDSIIGMLNTEDDIEGVELPNEYIKEHKLENEIVKFDDYDSMIIALINKEIDACFVPGNYTLFNIELESEDGQETTLQNIKDITKIIDYKEDDRANQDNKTLEKSKDKKLTEPFTALIMGVDSEYDGLKANQAFNGDTLILVTFNPKTLTATMFSFPRDIYVPIACNNKRYAKINSSAAYGSTCVINTIQNLTGIDIDYYVKMNFTGVVDLVNVLGGVEIDVEEPDYPNNFGYDCKGGICEQNSKRQWGASTVYIKPGLQTLDGEEALAYARNRHQFITGDLARNQHQQQVIQAVALKMKNVTSVSEFQKIMDTISRNLETNITPEQIMSFYDIGKDMLLNVHSSTLSIKKTYLNCYNLPVWIGSRVTSALGYQPASLDAIVNLMKENLGLKEVEPVKTFSISYNEDYTTPLVGQYEYGGNTLTVVPRFIGGSLSTATAWCEKNGFTCTSEYADSDEPLGVVIGQSIHEYTLMLYVKEKNMVLTLSNGKGANTTNPSNNDDDNDNKNNENNNEENNENNNEENNQEPQNTEPEPNTGNDNNEENNGE